MDNDAVAGPSRKSTIHSSATTASDWPGAGSLQRVPESISTVVVAHVIGPMWAVNGHVFRVAEGEDIRQTVLEMIARDVEASVPVRVAVTDGPRVTRVVLRPDGSSVAEGDDAAAWVGAGIVQRALAEPMRVIGVHGGSGATTWARLLELPEGQLTGERDGQIILVCRSTPAGISAAKTAIHTVGTAAVDVVLVVADAPGKPVPGAVREQKVLAGAVPVVSVPWIPRLRAVTEISPVLAGQVARPVQRVTKALQGAHLAKKEKAE
jgi:hypothetical protein